MKVYINKSKISGKGLYANQNIKKNEGVTVFKGKIVSYPYDNNFELGPNWICISKNKWLDLDKKSLGNFINRSCNPNSGFRGKRIVVAMRPIKKDEEITIDYSITEDDPFWKMKCSCGNKNCRKLIKSVRFLPKNLFLKYKDYIPKFLRESYYKNKI